MKINIILLSKYKKEFLIKQQLNMIKLANDLYMEELSEQTEDQVFNNDEWEIAYIYSFNKNIDNNLLSLREKLSHTKEMLSKALLEEEYELAAELQKLIKQIEDELSNS
jgi:hypothetical protein